MARNNTTFEPNQKWFDSIMRSEQVVALQDAVAEQTLAIAKANAPVDSGDYRDSLHIEHHDSRFRSSTRVVADDDKSMLIEAKTGNLARALRATKK